MFFDAKGFQNRAKMPPKIYEKTLQKTMPKTCQPIIKNILISEVPEPQKKLFSRRKTNILQIQPNSNIIKKYEK